MKDTMSNDEMLTQNRCRCAWVNEKNPLYISYHDDEWGVQVHDDQKLFEMLILEGAQAGLNWETILNRREGYREAFYHFDPRRVSNMSDDELEVQLQNEGIIRNRLKIYSVRKNARVFLDIQKECGSFDHYIWQFVDGVPVINAWPTLSSVPTKTSCSDLIAKDLKKRGMSFVGSTIIYAYMQAIGMVNDHTVDCWRYKTICAEAVKGAASHK